jgi:TolB protein
MRGKDGVLKEAKLVTLVVLVVASAVAASPGKAAYPGVAGPIAYSKVETSEVEYQGMGGIYVHGPAKRDAPRQLTDNPNDRSPSYSPNGRLIVFSGNRDPVPPTSPFGAPGSHIYLMNAEGGEIRQLTSGDFYDSNPSFSANGQVVAFDRSALSTSRTTHIFSVNVDGTGLRQITNEDGVDYDPVYTPNGKAIVFVSNRKSSGRRDRSNIFSMRPNGSHMRLLIRGPRNEYDPDVSPDGRRIAFVSSRGRGGIFIARMSGRHVRYLRGSRSGGNPSWAPDGKHIAFIRFGSESSELVVKRADGRGFSKEFDEGGTEEEGYGTIIGPPGWGPRPR